MLGTLLKYEFKAVGRILLPLFAAWLIASVLLGLSLGGNGSQSNLLITLTALVYIFVAVAAVVITTILLIQRFYKNLLGNEGYLMFTLPVSTGQHILNKTISGAVWGTAGLIIAILSGLLIVGCVEGFGSLFEEISFMTSDFKLVLGETPSAILLVPEILILVLLGFAGTAVRIYAAIAVGHQLNSYRILASIGAYLAFGIVESLISTPFGMLAESEKVFTLIDSIQLNMSMIGLTHLTVWGLIIICVIFTAIYGVVSWKLLDKRLNLE